ncbi:MAG: alpha-ketoacid dehydrogenase subunit beta [Lachnospiraceae bacterium]|nr:alpha-ketoacid dehydrogenase subunit beta [Lachnospiraceae bacterium]
MMRTITMIAAVREAIEEEMKRDENVIMLGEDIGEMGGPWGSAKGLLEEFGPGRIIQTPISEWGFTGISVGAAVRGMRPIAELMYNDFISVCLDPIMNQAAKMCYMTGGQVSVPMVLRAPTGTGRRGAAQHSQNMESLFAHIPGLKVIAPSCPQDAKGLLKSAIRDDDPVISLEHKFLYPQKGEVDDSIETIPLGVADVKREGSDVSIITWSRQVQFSLEAAEKLAGRGINAEILDLRTLVPLDWEAVCRTVCKTHRAVIVEEDVRRCGFGAEIAAEIGEKLFDELDAPVVRVASLNSSVPFAPELEEEIYPHPETIVRAVTELLEQ